MAYADYRLCDKCEEKVFYDQQLDYRFSSRQDPIEKDERAKVCGHQDTNYRLQYLGDWAVLCEQCAKTHRTAILPLNAPEPSGETMQQREEVCEAWATLPDDLRKDPRLTRLYRALGGPRMDDPNECPCGVGIPQPAAADQNCTYPRCLTEGCAELCRSVHPATAWPRIEDAIECLQGQLFHPSASHINPDYRDGWNRATNAALALLRKVAVTHGVRATVTHQRAAHLLAHPQELEAFVIAAEKNADDWLALNRELAELRERNAGVPEVDRCHAALMGRDQCAHFCGAAQCNAGVDLPDGAKNGTR